MNKRSFEERNRYSLVMNPEIHAAFKQLCKRYGVAMSDVLEYYALELIRSGFIDKPQVKETYVDYLVNGF